MGNKCIICGNDSVKFKKENFAGIKVTCIECERCGRYYIQSNLNTKYDKNKIKSCLLHYLLCYRLGEKRHVMIVENHSELLSGQTKGKYKIIEVESLLALYPTNFEHRINKIIMNLYVLDENDCSHKYDLFDSHIYSKNLFL